MYSCSLRNLLRLSPISFRSLTAFSLARQELFSAVFSARRLLYFACNSSILRVLVSIPADLSLSLAFSNK